ncbi:MAG: hypothetical protein H7138_12050 [Myxococcales bacterium]|nr:hypothetical protein [Myxococcales bacterium]
MRFVLLVALACLGVSGCEVSYVEAGSVVAQPQAARTPAPAKAAAPEVVALRDDVLAATEVVPGRREYTPKDPAFFPTIVDPAIAFAMQAQPSAARDALVTAAASSVATAFLREAEGVAAIEKLLTERYQRPAITRDGELVRIDLGYIPGKPSYFRGALHIESPFAENGTHGLVAREVIRNLQAGMAAHPDAKTYQVEVDIPGRWRGGDGYTYVYDRDEDRIRLYVQDERDVYYRTAVLGGSFGGIERLVWSTMESQPMDRPPVRSAALAARAR